MALKYQVCRRALRHKMLSGGLLTYVAAGFGVANLIGFINPTNFQSNFYAWVCTASIPFVLYWTGRWAFGSIVSFDETHMRWATLDARSKRKPIRRIKHVHVVEGKHGLLLRIRSEDDAEIAIPIETKADASTVEAEVRAHVDKVQDHGSR